LATPKNPELVALSDEMKAALRLLHSKFNIDFTTIKVSKIADIIEAPTKVEEIRYTNRYGGRLPQSAIDAQIRERQPGFVKYEEKLEETGDFKVGDLVTVLNDKQQINYVIDKVTKLPYGRTGWWCKLKYRYSEAKCTLKPVEASNLILIEEV
jgi:hypothetical protein